MEGLYCDVIGCKREASWMLRDPESHQDAVERCAGEQLKSIEQAISPLFEHSAILWRDIQVQGNPVDTILRVADREKVDLIVVGSQGLRGVKELLLGSISSGVLHHATCPVLIALGDNAPQGTSKFRNILPASDGCHARRKPQGSR